MQLQVHQGERGWGLLPERLDLAVLTSLVWSHLVQLKKTVSGSALIVLAQEKYGLQGNPSEYSLYQLLSDKRECIILLMVIFTQGQGQLVLG